MVSILTTADLEVRLPTKVHGGYRYAVYAFGEVEIFVGYSPDEALQAAEQALSFVPVVAKWDSGVWDQSVWGPEYAYFMDLDHWEPRPIADKVRITLTGRRARNFIIKDLGPVGHSLGRVRA
jgi:hypothetical protein